MASRMTSRDLKGQYRDPNMFGAHDLENGWRYQLDDNGAPIGNDYRGLMAT